MKYIRVPKNELFRLQAEHGYKFIDYVSQFTCCECHAQKVETFAVCIDEHDEIYFKGICTMCKINIERNNFK